MKIPSLILAVVTFFGASLALAASPKTISLWPGNAPGETASLPPESDQSKASDNLIAGRPLIRLGNVSHPTMTIYSPDPAKNTGAAVLVCPGGGYSILAYDLEGTEVCDWLNSIGVTAVLLKYRVPVRVGRFRSEPALQDAQRALGLIRQGATEWGIDPQRVGVLGFSAGGDLAALASTHDNTRTYPTVDAADALNIKPNFCVLIYPGDLTVKNKGDMVAPELTINASTAPTFLVMAEDDPVRVENVLFYYLALKNAKVPAEVHLYPTGGHGYGLRRTKDLVTTWPDRAADWMTAAGWLKTAKY